MLSFSFNKSYVFPYLFLSCALCFKFLVPVYISFPWGHKVRLIYLELEALQTTACCHGFLKNSVINRAVF